MEKLKVGQRIELVEVLTNGGYTEGKFIPGTIRPVSQYSIRVLANDGLYHPMLGICDEVRSVGAMIVKKVHSTSNRAGRLKKVYNISPNSLA